ncbi:MAG: SH3 domain-containing protein [Synergistaceae bacterium]|nr:SH3 domain-containing protein [Synergistaceae bacterium]
MRKFALTLILLIISALSGNSAFASDVIYPALGVCTGNGVRLRDSPGTDSEIIGKVNESDRLVLLAERKFRGDTWYAVDNPKDEGTAWIIARYVDITSEDGERTPAVDIAINVRMNFGIRPEKAKILLGKPRKDERDEFFFEPANQNLSEEILTYKGCSLRYVENNLRHVEVTESGWRFDEFKIGDSQEKLIKNIGDPSDKAGNTWIYEITPIESLEFTIKNNKIIKMEWNEYMDA